MTCRVKYEMLPGILSPIFAQSDPQVKWTKFDQPCVLDFGLTKINSILISNLKKRFFHKSKILNFFLSLSQNLRLRLLWQYSKSSSIREIRFDSIDSIRNKGNIQTVCKNWRESLSKFLVLKQVERLKSLWPVRQLVWLHKGLRI